MGRQIWRVAWLALLLGVGLALPGPVSGHPYHLMIDNSVLGTAEALYDTRLVGQSFVPVTDFVVTRVSLYLEDVGSSDVLNVSVRDCCIGGFPGPTTLGNGFVDGPAAPGWLDIDVSPTSPLSAGLTYWIVAESQENNAAQGYNWWNSGDDLAYGPGTAAVYDGVSWSWAGKDYSFRIYGYEAPTFAFSASVTPPGVGPGQSAALRANFTNSGPGTAAALWVNLTLPPELTYTGDDAGAIGGTVSGSYTFTFTNVSPGSYSFNVTVQAAGGIPDGTVVQARFAFTGTDHLGAPLAQEVHDVPVTMRNARLALSLTASPADVDPGDRIVVNATVANPGSSVAANVRAEATLDSNGTYVSSTPVGSYTSPTIQWPPTSIGPGGSTVFSWSLDVPLGTPDLASVTSQMRVTYDDPSGAPLPSETGVVTARVHAPIFAPLLFLDRSAGERGTEVVATLQYNNTGSTSAPQVWLNWTLGGHYQLVSLAPPLSANPTPGGFSIPITDVASGSHSVDARLRVVRGLQDGLAMGLSVNLAATDGNRNLLPTTQVGGSVDLHAPTLTVALATAKDTISTGSLFVLDVVVQNSGRASATAWLNLSIPSDVAYVADNQTFVVTRSGGRISWRVPAILMGSRVYLAITLRGQAASVASFRFSLDYTDIAGSPPLTVLSNSLALQFVGTGGSGWLWPWGAVAILAVFIPLLLFLAKFRVTVEEVFLVSHSGILLAHMSYALKHDRDRDVVSGMLTAVQEFIRDSFSTSEEGALQSLDFGQRRIIVKRGTSSYLAVILRGHGPSRLPRKMEETLRKFEKAFPQALHNVDGATLDGAGEVLSKELLGR